jgi:hypothetical protein
MNLDIIRKFHHYRNLQIGSISVKGDEEQVALQAVEFWSTIGDNKIGLQDENEGADDASYSMHFRFIEKALPSLVPMLLATLLEQEDDQDQDDKVWNISVSGRTIGLNSEGYLVLNTEVSR